MNKVYISILSGSTRSKDVYYTELTPTEFVEHVCKKLFIAVYPENEKLNPIIIRSDVIIAAAFNDVEEENS